MPRIVLFALYNRDPIWFIVLKSAGHAMEHYEEIIFSSESAVHQPEHYLGLATFQFFIVHLTEELPLPFHIGGIEGVEMLLFEPIQLPGFGTVETNGESTLFETSFVTFFFFHQKLILQKCISHDA